MKLAKLAALFVFLPYTSAMAQNVAQPCENEPCAAPVGAQGYVAFIDPETGELLSGDDVERAASDDARALFSDDIQAEMRAAFDPEGLTEVRTETGAVALNLQGRFQSPYVAHVGPDGITVGHTEIPD